MHLFGRCHIDQRNAMLWGDYGLEGTIESARVTCLPLQVAARVSPGTGISSMESLTALRTGVLVPWHKQQAEKPKTALDLIHADQGGMVYAPIAGLHANVGMVDFVSMYPSIMVHCNISPEVPAPTELGVSDYPPGLVPQTLGPLLKKRIALKQRALSLPLWDPRREYDKARSQAYKWLLVTCFGYLGYKNARFGRIESHEAVTTWGREALLERQGGRRGPGLHRAAHVRGWAVGAEGGLRIPGRFQRPAGGDLGAHAPAGGAGWGLPLGGLFGIPGGCARGGAQPLLRRLPGWLAQGARHRRAPARYARFHRGYPDGDPGVLCRRAGCRAACTGWCRRRWGFCAGG